MTDICTILLRNSNIHRQTISSNEVNHKLYSSVIDAPLDTPPLNTLEEAEEYCRISWGIDPSGVWEFQWADK